MKTYISLILLFCIVNAHAGELDGLNAVVTGGSRGIGEACVFALGREGASVSLCKFNVKRMYK